MHISRRRPPDGREDRRVNGAVARHLVKHETPVVVERILAVEFLLGQAMTASPTLPELFEHTRKRRVVAITGRRQEHWDITLRGELVDERLIVGRGAVVKGDVSGPWTLNPHRRIPRRGRGAIHAQRDHAVSLNRQLIEPVLMFGARQSVVRAEDRHSPQYSARVSKGSKRCRHRLVATNRLKRDRRGSDVSPLRPTRIITQPLVFTPGTRRPVYEVTAQIGNAHYGGSDLAGWVEDGERRWAVRE